MFTFTPIFNADQYAQGNFGTFQRQAALASASAESCPLRRQPSSFASDIKHRFLI
jgi:hypothetical protein